MSIALGLLAEMGIQFLRQVGQGGYSVLSGFVFLALGFLVKKKRLKIALIIALTLYALDGFFFLKAMALYNPAGIAGGVLLRVFLFILMYRGLGAIDELNNQVLQEPETLPSVSLPQDPSHNPVSVSFVAPFGAATPSIHNSAAAEIRTKPVAADFVASVIRYLVYRCEISATGMRVIYSSGKQKDYTWNEFSTMIVRQLPQDQPWQGKTLLDLIPADAAVSYPVRLFSSTYVNYSFLPQGISPSSQENIRRLGLFILQQNTAISLEPWTAQFLHASRSPLRFTNLAQFADYNSRFA